MEYLLLSVPLPVILERIIIANFVAENFTT